MYEVRRYPGIRDISYISEQPALHQHIFEDFSSDNYLNGYIEKPWGHEYRIYCDDLYDIWKLRLDPGQATSMHCHLRKDTVLLCLAGSGETAFIDGTRYALSQGSLVYIKKGVFHQTKANSKGLHLIEVENPRNKFDLMRIRDHYGRAATQYENADSPVADVTSLVEILPNRWLRNRDISNQFKFELSKLRSEEISKNINNFFVLLTVEQHLSGSIEVLSGKDSRLQGFNNNHVLIISYNT